MTTFQDPPPQSRRAVRQSERGETSAPAPEQGVPYAFDANQADANQAEPSTPQPSETPHHSGRRAQLPTGAQQPVAAEQGSAPAPGFEPLTYSTQGRVSPPASEVSQQQPLAAAPPPGSPEQGSFRVRDFSPEGGRRAAPPRQPVTNSPLSAAASFPPPTRPVDLDYQTQGVAAPRSHSAANVPTEDTVNHTLSRRELREMRAAAEQQAPQLQEPPAQLAEAIDTLLNSGPIEIPTLAPPPGQSQALAEAMAEFDLLTRSRREAEARARDAQVASLATPIVPTQQQPIVQQSVPQPPIAAAPIEPQAIEPQSTVPQAIEPQLVEPQLTELPPPSVPQPLLADPPMLSDPVFLEPQLDAEPVDPTDESPDHDAHGGRSPRASNHWRVQAAIEDDELPYENTLSRTVGSNTSAITTSALVLPSVPLPDSMLAPLNATGEILVTGSINLPRSLGSTGAHPDRVDNSDYEDDPFDSQVAAPDSAPVRAIRAISSNTSTRGVIETKRPQGNRALTAVIIVAGTLCVGLLGLLIFAFASGKL
jgi:hypothetical protein